MMKQRIHEELLAFYNSQILENKTDKEGNYIGDGRFHVDYEIIDFSDYPQIKHAVNKSETTESVYVTYLNTENNNRVTVRFSGHNNNATKFGDQLNGYLASENEILHRLGILKRKFIPNKRLYIDSKMVKKSDVDKYEVAELTVPEMYSLGVGGDLTQYKGKLGKGSNRLILGDKVEEFEETTKNAFGETVRVGKYEYY